jgi:hypothetical protein
MYGHAKMRPVETVPGMGGGGIKENDGGVNSAMTDCKHFCKCHNAPPPSTSIKIKKKLKRL